MARGGKAEKGEVRSLLALLLALPLLSGCETINEALVRQIHKEPGLSRRMNNQIREGLERRKAAPPGTVPRRTAPGNMDQAVFRNWGKCP
jgi:hypothetical protein